MKKLTVFDFCSQIGAASDEIPVVVRVGLQEIGHFRSLYQIPAVAMPGILEAKVTFVTVKCTQIIIQVKTKDYNTTIWKPKGEDFYVLCFGFPFSPVHYL